MIEWLLVLLLGVTFPAPLPPLPGGQATTHLAGRAPAGGPTAAMAPGLDLVTVAVEDAESSGGVDKRMWRTDPRGPLGPMQVSEAAAIDVGGGDRFDFGANREIGRAYLAEMFRRYGNWPDAVIAYNWGPGKLDRWIAVGRPPESFPARIKSYVGRVLQEIENLSADRSAAPVVPPAPMPVPVVAPLTPEIRNPALRRAFLRDQAEITQLRDLAAAINPPGAELKAQSTGAVSGRDAQDALGGLIRHIATRPGFEEFRMLPSAKFAAPATASADRQIAVVLIGKLQSESTTLLLVDQRQNKIR